jgi:hypothetical protein
VVPAVALVVLTIGFLLAALWTGLAPTAVPPERPTTDGSSAAAALRALGGGDEPAVSQRVRVDHLMWRTRVTDEHGAAMVGIEFGLERFGVPRARAIRGGGGELEFTGEHLVPGAYELRPIGRSHELVSPAKVWIGDENSPTTVVVRPWSSLRGVVADVGGAPVGDVRLRAATGEGPVEATTTGEGRFELYAPARELGQEVALVIDDPGRCQPPDAAVIARWGDGDVAVRLAPATQLRPRVRDSSGEPVVRFGVRCRPAAFERAERERLRLVGLHADGVAVVPGVWTGLNYLQVVPDVPALTPSVPLSVEVTGGPVEVAVELLERQRVPVRVVDSLGRGVSSVACDLIDPVGRAVGSDTPVVDPTTLGLSPALWRRRIPRVESQGITGQDGVAVLFAPADSAHFVLRAVRRYREPIVRALERLPTPGSEVRIEVDAGVRVHGTTSPRPPASWQAAVSLHSTSSKTTQLAQLAPDGSYVFEDGPAGDRELSLVTCVVSPATDRVDAPSRAGPGSRRARRPGPLFDGAGAPARRSADRWAGVTVRLAGAPRSVARSRGGRARRTGDSASTTSRPAPMR